MCHHPLTNEFHQLFYEVIWFIFTTLHLASIPDPVIKRQLYGSKIDVKKRMHSMVIMHHQQNVKTLQRVQRS